MTFTEREGEVILQMKRDDYDVLQVMCRYAAAGCVAPPTHFCAQCEKRTPGHGWYCAAHAKRHDQ